MKRIKLFISTWKKSKFHNNAAHIYEMANILYINNNVLSDSHEWMRLFVKEYCETLTCYYILVLKTEIFL